VEKERKLKAFGRAMMRMPWFLSPLHLLWLTPLWVACVWLNVLKLGLIGPLAAVGSAFLVVCNGICMFLG
jgi:hypothetical protein